MPFDSFWYLRVPSDYLRSLEAWKLQKGLMPEAFVHESEVAPILTYNFLKLFACKMEGQ